MKILFALTLAIVLFSSCETPYRIITSYSTDSTGKSIKTVQKYYLNTNNENSNAFDIALGYSSMNAYSYGYPFLWNPYMLEFNLFTNRYVTPVRPKYNYRPYYRYYKPVTPLPLMPHYRRH